MSYKEYIQEGENILHVSRQHIIVMTYPLVFSGIFGLVFAFGALVIPEFRVICYIITVIFFIYPLMVVLLLINTRWVVTDKRIIEQLGVFSRIYRFIEFKDIEKIAFYQTNFGKKIKCGDVKIKTMTEEKKVQFKVFKFMKKPHEFIVKLQDALEKFKANL